MQQELIAFVSGPLDASWDYFSEHYLTTIDTAIVNNHSFVVGDSKGIDTLALEYLLTRVPATKVTVFTLPRQAASVRKRLADHVARGLGIVVVTERHALSDTSLDAANFLHEDRDFCCTAASHYDILRYRSDSEAKLLYGARWRPRISGTERNERRRNAGFGLPLPTPTAQINQSDALAGEEKEDKKCVKEIRILQRKIKEIYALQFRQNNGMVLEANQLQKISKLVSLKLELLKLGKQEKHEIQELTVWSPVISRKIPVLESALSEKSRQFGADLITAGYKLNDGTHCHPGISKKVLLQGKINNATAFSQSNVYIIAYLPNAYHPGPGRQSSCKLYSGIVPSLYISNSYFGSYIE
ncbi:hypothetical protein HK100_006419 [Physocladia obscura]|uniref:Uncharacterized protein n=1 Tax=Physocladia obscura TaxID=109957 RepID=A0AAD5ST75_9FUNG|nr:hypothetical protein HK100_006419 [Physocladia obscura]